MIFVQLFFNNFCDNFFSHTHIMVLLSHSIVLIYVSIYTFLYKFMVVIKVVIQIIVHMIHIFDKLARDVNESIYRHK